MFVSVSFTVSWLMVAYAPRLPLVLAGRLTSGLCAGLCCVAVPAYIVEISTVETRGLLTAGFQLSFAVGVFLEISLGIFLRWSWLAVCGAAIVVFASCLMLCMPESPPWLMRMSRSGEGMAALRFLRGDSAIEEFRDISESLTEEPENGLSLGELLRPELYKPLGISISLMFLQQFGGINALMAYSVRIFEDAEIKAIDPTAAAAIVALVQILATIPSGLLMDKKGRKLLFMLSGSCMAMSLTAAGLHSRLCEQGEWSWVPVVTLITYMVGFALGFGPIPFVVTPEIVPLHSRSFVIAVASATNSFFSFVVIQTFDDLRGFLGMAGAYWSYAAVALLGVVFYWRCVPETKGLTLRDIHRSFSLRPDHYEKLSSQKETSRVL